MCNGPGPPSPPLPVAVSECFHVLATDVGCRHVPKFLVTLIPTIILIQKDAVPARDSVQLPNPERLHDDVTRPRPASGRLFGSGDGWLRLTTVPTVGVEESGDGCHRVKGSVTV